MTLNLQPVSFPSDRERPFILAGPCSAESEKQVLEAAHALAALGYKTFRAGAWKPRTKPGSFEGHGEVALKWMVRAKEETGLLLATEVATPEHVELCMKYGIDYLWVGARTSANPFAVQALADALQGTDIPLLVKNPINPDIELWIGTLERFNRAGLTHLVAVHRGFSSYENKIYRNLPMWHIPIELHRRYPELPIVVDPSHIGGKRELIAPLCQQAMDMGFDGLIIETHPHPDEAWSDAEQQVTPTRLHEILSHLIVRSKTITTESINELRRQIDELDDQLMSVLSRRMHVCRQIGQYKKEHNITVLQSTRYGDILARRGAQSQECSIAPEAVAHIFEIIHEESVRQQIVIVNK